MLTSGEADAALSGGQRGCACDGAFRRRWLGKRGTGGAAYPGRWVAVRKASAALIAGFRQRRGAGCGQVGHAGGRWVDKGCFVLDNVEQSKVLEIQRPFAMAGCPRVERVREGRFASGRRGLAGIGGRCAAWSSFRQGRRPTPATPDGARPPDVPAGMWFEGGIGHAAEWGAPRVS